MNGLPDTKVVRATETVHVLGDGDNIMLGCRLGTGEELTAIVYIGHNMGALVKNAFVLDEPIDPAAEAQCSAQSFRGPLSLVIH